MAAPETGVGNKAIRTNCRMPVISSVSGIARGLLSAPFSWSSAVRVQVGASAVRWKET
jgi:hypothetical protein